MQEKLSTTFRALRSGNFRLYFFGQGVSLIGTWMQRIAIQWLVYHLTGSPLLLGVVGFASHIPIFILSPFTGVFIDRMHRKKLLFVTQFLAMFQALLLAFLVLAGKIEIWHLVLLSSFLGIINAFDIPARQALYVKLVDRREDLPNAIALNSTLFHISRLLGPSAAGFLIAAVGEGICFLINGLSYVAVLASIVALKFKDERNGLKESIILQFKENLFFVFQSRAIRNSLLFIGLISLVGAPYMTLLPIFAKDVLKGGPLALGLLTSSLSVGALIASLYIAAAKNSNGVERKLSRFAVVFGLGLMVFAFSESLAFSISVTLIMGAAFMAYNTSANVIFQVLSPDERRGSVMSFYNLFHLGMMPFGELLFGALAAGIGAPFTLALGGAATILIALIFVPRAVARKI